MPLIISEAVENGAQLAAVAIRRAVRRHFEVKKENRNWKIGKTGSRRGRKKKTVSFMWLSFDLAFCVLCFTYVIC